MCGWTLEQAHYKFGFDFNGLLDVFYFLAFDAQRTGTCLLVVVVNLRRRGKSIKVRVGRVRFRGKFVCIVTLDGNIFMIY